MKQSASKRAYQITSVQIKKYHNFKEITQRQNGNYAEDTNRYGWAMDWYETIRSTIEEWKKDYPNNAEAIQEILGIGKNKTPKTVTAVSINHHMAEGTVYNLRKEFITEVMVKALSKRLIHI